VTTDMPTIQTAPADPIPAMPAISSLLGGDVSSLDDVRRCMESVRGWIRDNVMGRDDVIELVLVALFSGGHVLLEDYPGSGKTTLANALGNSIIDDAPDRAGGSLPEFRRIQFTPDLLPSDVTGVMIFDVDSNQFHFRRGPVFAYVLLVDEINRTTPKVQSALLEAMAERQVTVDNTTHKLDPLFFVIATQNPLDAVGTYPLPVAQLDRFLFKIQMKHIARAAELEVLRSWGSPREATSLPKVARSEVLAARSYLRNSVFVAPAIHECLVDIAHALRNDKRVLQGVSTRSLVLAIPALQALATLRGRDFVAPEDIEHLAIQLFMHRMELIPGVDDAKPVIRDCLKQPIETLSRNTFRKSA